MSVSQDVVFIGNNTQAGTLASDPSALWETDGTVATEVQPFADPTTTIEGTPTAAYASLDGAPLPGSLLFDLEVSTYVGSSQVYVTDPATGTPRLLSVPNLPTTGDAPSDATSVGQVVLFAAAQADGTRVLWRSDGTAGGTSVVAVPGASAGGVDPQSITTFDGGALFVGNGADNPGDVFFTDGTTTGTREIAALLPVYGNGTEFQPLGALNSREIFVGPGPQAVQPGLYATDGTAAGTVAIATLPYGASDGLSSAVAGSRLLYAAVGLTLGLYATDGTAAGTSQILPSETAGDLVSLGDKVVLTVSTPTARNALWVSDGTTAGTAAIAIANLPQPQQIFASDLTRFGNQVLFAGQDTIANSRAGTSYGLWITDGTAAGTREIAPGVNPYAIVALPDGQAYFAGIAGNALYVYVTDGTAAGTRMVPGTAGLNPTSITVAPSPLAFTGTQAQYDLAPTAAGVLQTRDLSAGGATLALPNARVLTFGDGTTAVFDASGNAEAIARIYLAAYGQAPDLAGLLAYTQQADAGTVSLAQIAAAAPISAQFLAAGTLTDAQFVTKLYQDADGRAPDAGGLAAYTQALAAGQTRGQVLLAIAESPEARVHSQSVAGNANDATITRLYEAIDARAPDPGGLAAYGAALDAGQSVAQIAAAMLASPEYASRFEMPGGEFQVGMPPDNTVFVTELYQNLLGRAPDAGGLASYTAALAGGETRAQLVAGFVASDEARLATAPLTHLGYVSLG